MKNLYILFLLTFGIAACSSPTQQVNKVMFNVDAKLLNPEPYFNKKLNFTINAPINWQTEHAIIPDTAENVLAVYTNNKTKASLLVTNLTQIPDNEFSNLKKNKEQAAFVEQNWANHQKTEFIHNGFFITQYVLQNQQAITFKLICEKSGIDGDNIRLLLDYFIPSTTDINQFKPIESSIGSLKSLN